MAVAGVLVLWALLAAAVCFVGRSVRPRSSANGPLPTMGPPQALCAPRVRPRCSLQLLFLEEEPEKVRIDGLACSGETGSAARTVTLELVRPAHPLLRVGTDGVLRRWTAGGEVVEASVRTSPGARRLELATERSRVVLDVDAILGELDLVASDAALGHASIPYRA